MTNADVARRLREHAAELSRGGTHLYRARAFRQAALAVLALDRSPADLGPAGLRAVPGIGPSLARTIAVYAETGRWEPRTPARRAG